jgi:hypothetical protein
VALAQWVAILGDQCSCLWRRRLACLPCSRVFHLERFVVVHVLCRSTDKSSKHCLTPARDGHQEHCSRASVPGGGIHQLQPSRSVRKDDLEMSTVTAGGGSWPLSVGPTTLSAPQASSCCLSSYAGQHAWGGGPRQRGAPGDPPHQDHTPSSRQLKPWADKLAMQSSV